MKTPGLSRRAFLAGTAASASLLLAPLPLHAATPEEDAADRLTADADYLKRPWKTLPFDPEPFSYTFEELETHWDTLLRGYQIPFPSPEYLRKRYARYPQLWKELRFQDEDYAMHSRNALEVWLQFFRGDFQAARNLGYEYGGFSRVPALFAQLIYSVYLAETLKEKHALLQDAVEGVTYYGTVFQPRPADDLQYKSDYVMIRLGYAYGLGRVAEDVSIPTALARDYIGKVTSASNDILTVYPEHPMGLALSAGIGANIIRRAGALGAKVVFGASGDDAKTRFETSFAMVPDVALTRFEYANSMLYVDNAASIDESIKQLELAASFVPRHAIEALDIAYAKKRLVEVLDYKQFGGGFGSYDRKRRKYQNQSGQNLYCVTGDPFLVSKV
ncbi:MAG: hypothetical protein ACOY3X_08180 [Pseudomonadota bacterium]